MNEFTSIYASVSCCNHTGGRGGEDEPLQQRRAAIKHIAGCGALAAELDAELKCAKTNVRAADIKNGRIRASKQMMAPSKRPQAHARPPVSL